MSAGLQTSSKELGYYMQTAPFGTGVAEDDAHSAAPANIHLAMRRAGVTCGEFQSPAHLGSPC